jgi:hypothetical protein
MRAYLRLLFCLFSLSFFLNNFSIATAQTGSPAAQPTPPGPAPKVSPVPTPNPAAPITGGAQGSQPANTAGTATPAIDPRLDQALKPIQHTPAPNPQRTPPAGQGTFIFDWATGSATPDTIYHSGNSTLRLTNVNDILFSSQVTVTEIKTSTNDLSQLSDLVKQLPDFTPQKTNALAGVNACTLESDLQSAQTALSGLQTKLDALFPALRPGKCSSVPLGRTLADWTQIRKQYDQFEGSVTAVQRALENQQCRQAPNDVNVPAAVQLIADKFPELQRQVAAIQARVNGPHVLDVNYNLKRTSDYDVAVSETCNGTATDHATVTFHLNRGFDVLTLSGGFLMTKLQARSYSVVAEPTPPPPGSPSGTPPGTQNVLGVDGLGSGMRGALVALLNYHNPIESLDKWQNFGLALSAGPVFDISQGKADTSKFGVFVGGSVHLWNRLFITPGVHFGEFADFPAGFHFAGDPVPANFGTPNPTKRWTGHFAFAITFKGKDLTNLTPGSNNSNPTPAPPAPSTPK